MTRREGAGDAWMHAWMDGLRGPDNGLNCMAWHVPPRLSPATIIPHPSWHNLSTYLSIYLPISSSQSSSSIHLVISSFMLLTFNIPYSTSSPHNKSSCEIFFRRWYMFRNCLTPALLTWRRWCNDWGHGRGRPTCGMDWMHIWRMNHRERDAAE